MGRSTTVHPAMILRLWTAPIWTTLLKTSCVQHPVWWLSWCIGLDARSLKMPWSPWSNLRNTDMPCKFQVSSFQWSFLTLYSHTTAIGYPKSFRPRVGACLRDWLAMATKESGPESDPTLKISVLQVRKQQDLWASHSETDWLRKQAFAEMILILLQSE